MRDPQGKQEDDQIVPLKNPGLGPAFANQPYVRHES
jgi:hypothetical protein